MVETDFEITDDMIRDMHVRWEQQKLKSENPFVFDLIRVLAKYSNGAKRSIVIDLILSKRQQVGLEIPKSFDETVQAAMNFHCKDSDVFKERGAQETEALFSWPKGKGAGFWKLERENTREWLNRKASGGHV